MITSVETKVHDSHRCAEGPDGGECDQCVAANEYEARQVQRCEKCGGEVENAICENCGCVLGVACDVHQHDGELQRDADAEAVLTDIDTVLGQVEATNDSLDTLPVARTFPDVINQWTEEMLKLNGEAKSIEAIGLVMRLGILGQRLIYESNALGVTQGLAQALQAMKERGV